MGELISDNIKKIVYTDNGVDKAVWGKIISESELFIEVLKQDNTKQTIGKRVIVTIKEVASK